MINFSEPYQSYKENKRAFDRVIIKTLVDGSYILGENVKRFEKNFSNYLNTKYSIAVANGTDAIHLGLRSLNIGKGDEVIVPSHTAIGTVYAVEMSGAKVVFADIEKDFFTIDPKSIKKKITKKTKAIICVHLYGQSCDLKNIVKLAKNNNLSLIEDCSQAHGAKYQRKKVGNFGTLSCFSLYPTKNLGAFGDAGIITTNNKKVDKKLKLLRQYGWNESRKSKHMGWNSRMDEIQAAILNIKIKKLDFNNKRRKEIAKIYNQNLNIKHIEVPKIRNVNDHVFYLYVIKCKKRNQLKKFLKNNGVNTGIHYLIPVHKEKTYIKQNIKLEETEKVPKEVLSLPCYPELKLKDQEKVINLIKYFLKNNF